MVIDVNFEYYSHWKRWFKYRTDTPTYSLFLRRIDNDDKFKNLVEGYIDIYRTDRQKQVQLEKTLIFH